MWENAAQMQIMSLNWWQYAWRVWSHANSAQPHNSHLVPQLKINTAHWNNWNYILVEHDIALLTPPLVACAPASSGQKSLTRQGRLSTRVRTLPGRTAAHALFRSATVEGDHPCLGSIWSQTCSIGFMSGLRAGQSMTLTSCWSKQAAVSHAVWGSALSWTYTKLRPNTPVAHGNIWFLEMWMYRCRFMAPSTMTSSPLTPPLPGLHPIPWLTGHDLHY